MAKTFEIAFLQNMTSSWILCSHKSIFDIKCLEVEGKTFNYESKLFISNL